MRGLSILSWSVYALTSRLTSRGLTESSPGEDESLHIEEQLHGLQHIEGIFGKAMVEIVDEDDHSPRASLQVRKYLAGF
jgi:hypothetical protein